VRLLVADVPAANGQSGAEVREGRSGETEVAEERPRDVVRKAVVTHLGEELVAGGGLARSARARTGQVIGQFVQEARAHGAERVLLVGTSAVREAIDGREFLRAVALTCGAHWRVLSGTEEAALTYRGVTLGFDHDLVVFDVGGGSTELVCRQPDGLLDVVSLPMGASRATAAWMRSDPPKLNEIDQVKKEAAVLLAPLQKRFGAAFVGQAQRRLVGVAGTVTTLACLALGLSIYDRAAIHGFTLTKEEVERLLSLLAGLSLRERSALACMQPGRAEVIVAGTAIVLAALEVLGYGGLTVSERDLLDGLIVSLPELCRPATCYGIC